VVRPEGLDAATRAVARVAARVAARWDRRLAGIKQLAESDLQAEVEPAEPSPPGP
jgi:hypothetical protein